MSSFLRVADRNVNRNECPLVDRKMWCSVANGLSWLYLTVGQPVCYLAGKYEMKCVGEMMDRTSVFHGRDVKRVRQRTFSVKGSRTRLVVVTDLDFHNHSKYLDVRSLQSMLRNRGATFQVASNFNGLEYTSSSRRSNRRDLGIARYVHDTTQGPAASESACPGTMLRNYYMNSNDVPESGQFVHDDAKMGFEANLLDGHPDLKRLYPVTNGYVVHDRPMDQEIEDYFRTDEALFRHMKIARHDCVQVTFGQYHDDSDKLEVCEDPNQLVNQVFFASINLGSVRIENWKNAARVVKELTTANMIGSLIAARENSAFLRVRSDCHGRRRFFPNLVGCGVFGNQRSWIIDTWKSDQVFPYLFLSGLEIIACFPADSTEEIIAFAEQAQKGTIPGFKGYTLQVDIVKASDVAKMNAIFGDYGLPTAPEQLGIFVAPPGPCDLEPNVCTEDESRRQSADHHARRLAEVIFEEPGDEEYRRGDENDDNDACDQEERESTEDGYRPQSADHHARRLPEVICGEAVDEGHHRRQDEACDEERNQNQTCCQNCCGLSGF